MDLGLKGKRALVTAASRGLGRACAAVLAAEGARVYISSRDPQAIERAGRETGAVGWTAADMSKAADVERLVKAAADLLGGIDIVVGNAGGPPPGTFQDVRLETWEKAVQLTLLSAVRLVTAALGHLKRSEQGRVVFITSISARQPIPDLVLSNSLRGAVTGLAKSLARELAPDRITVNCLAPDAILTDRIRELAGGDEESVRLAGERMPMKRYGDPAEFGAACAFLCSSHAGYITGQTLGIDGGSLLGVH